MLLAQAFFYSLAKGICCICTKGCVVYYTAAVSTCLKIHSMFISFFFSFFWGGGDASFWVAHGSFAARSSPATPGESDWFWGVLL